MVYCAEHALLPRAAAGRILRPEAAEDAAAVRRLLSELRALAQLDHGAFPRLADFGEHRGRPYLVMDLVAGEPLAAAVRRGPLAEERVRRIAAQLAAALQHAHDRGVAHGRLRSEEVLLAAEEGAEVARIVDFGNAVWLAEERSGVPGHEPGRAADQLALGWLGDEMLTGVPPLPAPCSEAALGQAPPIVAPSRRRLDLVITRELEAVIMRALRRGWQERFPSLGELRRELEQGAPTGRDLRHCPRCGRSHIDDVSHGSPGTGRCTACGTLFTVLATPA